MSDLVWSAKRGFHYSGAVDSLNGEFYEVFRVMDSKPLFLTEHLQRFQHSLQHLLLPVSIIEIKKIINEYLLRSGLQNGNLKITLRPDSELLLFRISHHYPSSKQLHDGVRLALLEASRENPTLKQFQAKLRAKVDQMIISKRVYEVVLISGDLITEGSRSNIFFIRQETLFTAPQSMVLSGITREKVIELALNNGVKVIENPAVVSELSSYQSAFITGTSPGILPVSCINNVTFDVRHPLLIQIKKMYNDLLHS